LKQITESTVREKKRLQGIVRVCAVVSNKATWKDDIKKDYLSTKKMARVENLGVE